MEEKRSSGRAKRQAKVLDEGYWDCSVCTYKNSPEAYKCEMCDVRKGTSTRKPRINPQLVAQQVAQQFAPPPKKERSGSERKKEKSEETSSSKHNGPIAEPVQPQPGGLPYLHASELKKILTDVKKQDEQLQLQSKEPEGADALSETRKKKKKKKKKKYSESAEGGPERRKTKKKKYHKTTNTINSTSGCMRKRVTRNFMPRQFSLTSQNPMEERCDGVDTQGNVTSSLHLSQTEANGFSESDSEENSTLSAVITDQVLSLEQRTDCTPDSRVRGLKAVDIPEPETKLDDEEFKSGTFGICVDESVTKSRQFKPETDYSNNFVNPFVHTATVCVNSTGGRMYKGVSIHTVNSTPNCEKNAYTHSFLNQGLVSKLTLDRGRISQSGQPKSHVSGCNNIIDKATDSLPFKLIAEHKNCERDGETKPSQLSCKQRKRSTNCNSSPCGCEQHVHCSVLASSDQKENNPLTLEKQGDKARWPPRLKNVDRSKATHMAVTVGDVTVIVTDYQPKTDARSSDSHIYSDASDTNSSTTPHDLHLDSPSEDAHKEHKD